ncbi:hypothetical protein F5Y14DRAFT_437826 [Nemania sp. NC0429]|nr:hypothetical protein F5Y14DRAFT_437826 [Nemania sp. NC0429]
MTATDTNQPLLEGVIWTITGLSLVFFCLRIFIKWKYRGKLWYDDYTLAASMLFLLVNGSLVQRIIVWGYGAHVDDVASENVHWIIAYLQIVSGVVRLSTNLARASFAITLLQLSNEREKVFVWFALLTMLAVTTPAIILPFVSCRPYSKIFDPSIPGTCIDQAASVAYFNFEGAYTALIDFLLVALPWWIISKLQMRRVERLGASLGLSLGVLSGVVTIIRAVYTNKITDPDWTYTSVDLAIWNMVEPASVIIAASLPNLRVFLIRTGNFTWIGGRAKSKSNKTDEVDLDQVQSTMNAISAGGDRRRGEATAWITSRGARGSRGEDEDDDSAKSILYEGRAGVLPISGIIQTSTFAIEYPEDAHSTSTREGR